MSFATAAHGRLVGNLERRYVTLLFTLTMIRIRALHTTGKSPRFPPGSIVQYVHSPARVLAPAIDAPHVPRRRRHPPSPRRYKTTPFGIQRRRTA
ncbi:hypothetical protein OF83DRAFT_1283832 [Amylostereum chailletii]|nr:hypothetical protein OF83DRAFT_1283832 [Amylostereum chailletii]